MIQIPVLKDGQLGLMSLEELVALARDMGTPPPEPPPMADGDPMPEADPGNEWVAANAQLEPEN